MTGRSDEVEFRFMFNDSLQPFREYAEFVKEYIKVNADQPIGGSLKINEKYPLDSYKVIKHTIFELIFMEFIFNERGLTTDEEAFKRTIFLLDKARVVSVWFRRAYVDESKTAEVETFRQIEENSINAFQQRLIDEGLDAEGLNILKMKGELNV